MLAVNLKVLLSCFVAFIALVNPIHKVFVINTLQSQFDAKEIRMIAYRSTLTASAILLIFLFLGQLVFNYVFHIELYAFQITCGVVLFYNGLSGLQNGIFVKLDKNKSVKNIIAVPIAIPMIAGPATITAAVTFPSHYGHIITITSIFIAMAINLVFMLYASKIGEWLNKLNLMNSLIRIFGLIVATIGVQLILNGVQGFVLTLSH